MNQTGLNSQLVIGLGGSQRSNLNSKYLSGKYPHSFIWVHCVQYTYLDLLLVNNPGFVAVARTKPELTLLERASSCLRAES